MPDDNSTRFYRGRSMAGTFRPGDRLAVIPVSVSDVRPGDVVVYRGQNHEGDAEELVHRVVAVAPGGLVTQGDNNPCADTVLVTADNLVGRVTHVERDGKTWPVRGGWLGLLRSHVLHARYPLWKIITFLGRKPYRWLRGSGLVARLWRPAIVKVRLAADDGPLVKYACGGRTVACWWPQANRFECQKPYDLVIPRPDGKKD